MKKILLVSLLIVAFTTPALADADRNKQAIRETLEPSHGGGGATGACSIMYYDLCSGWLWIWNGWELGDQVGVCFDLPNDCGKLPGEHCFLTHFWWYWYW